MKRLVLVLFVVIGSFGALGVGGLGSVAPRKERKVGLFYFLWLGEHGRKGPYDVTKIFEADPDAGQKPDSPLLLLLAAKRLNMV